MATKKKLTSVIIDALEDIKARDIILLNVSKLTSVFDYLAIASADSTRQTKALAGHVFDKVSEYGGKIYGTEGEQSGEWVLVDCGDVVVHIMQPAVREHYKLEELWGDGKREFPKPAAETKPRKAPAPVTKAKSKVTAAKQKTVAKKKLSAVKKPVAEEKPVVKEKPVAEKKSVTRKQPAAPKTVVAKKPVATRKVATKVVATARKKPIAKRPIVKKVVAKKPIAKKIIATKPATKKVAKRAVAKAPVSTGRRKAG